MKKDWWDDLTNVQKADITQSELEFERGEYISCEDLMKKYRQDFLNRILFSSTTRQDPNKIKKDIK